MTSLRLEGSSNVHTPNRSTDELRANHYTPALLCKRVSRSLKSLDPGRRVICFFQGSRPPALKIPGQMPATMPCPSLCAIYFLVVLLTPNRLTDIPQRGNVDSIVHCALGFGVTLLPTLSPSHVHRGCPRCIFPHKIGRAHV